MKGDSRPAQVADRRQERPVVPARAELDAVPVQDEPGGFGLGGGDVLRDGLQVGHKPPGPVDGFLVPALEFVQWCDVGVGQESPEVRVGGWVCGPDTAGGDHAGQGGGGTGKETAAGGRHQTYGHGSLTS